MQTAKTINAEHQSAQEAVTDLKASMKVLANTLLLQTRDTTNVWTSAVEVKLLLKKHLQAERIGFTLFPVGAMRSANSIRDRHLLIWCSTSEARCIAQPFDLTERARQAITDASKTRLFEYLLDKVKERGRDRLIALETGLARNSQSELDGHPLYATVLEAAQGVWGRPAMAEATQPRPLSCEQEDAGPALPGAQTEDAQPTNRCAIVKKGSKRQYEEDEQQVADDGEAMAPRKKARRAKGSKKDSSFKAEMEGLKWVMGLLPTAGDEKAVPKLSPPPPHHPRVSVLKPIFSTPPALEAPEPENTPSPLDYTTGVGNAWVVHRIYSEARRATRPRTAAEERSRRKRALQLAFKEIVGVVKDIEWYRRRMGFTSGPQPSVLIGLEEVPEQAQRAWLLKKLDVLKERQCQVRCAIAENRAARLHIIAVIDAV